MNTPNRFIGAVFVLFALSGCGSPGDNTSFKPPSGWKSTPGVMGRFQMWLTGQSDVDRQVVILIRGDKNMNFTDNSRAWNGSSSISDFKHSTITLCGNQKADYYSGRGQGGSANNRKPESIEAVTSDIGDSKFAVIYVRPLKMHADGSAEAALHSICPLK